MIRVTFGVGVSAHPSLQISQCNRMLWIMLRISPRLQVLPKHCFTWMIVSPGQLAEEAIDLHNQLVTLFNKGGFLLRKWNSSDM